MLQHTPSFSNAHSSLLNLLTTPHSRNHPSASHDATPTSKPDANLSIPPKLGNYNTIRSLKSLA
ncbi:hypothetical protein TSUD_37660 [Trifolium subterraneum]|uniref:Uncharacterized protein n=1 Tax=Trifolium subterraneum TaxID=3900 RepID=A0A2Z6MG13_TRISU|nr:hypothetical protein TSUD_37660 [Trifolium subterraneum]